MVKFQKFSYNEAILYDYKIYGYIVLNIWRRIILNEYNTKYGLESCNVLHPSFTFIIIINFY